MHTLGAAMFVNLLLLRGAHASKGTRRAFASPFWESAGFNRPHSDNSDAFSNLFTLGVGFKNHRIRWSFTSYQSGQKV